MESYQRTKQTNDKWQMTSTSTDFEVERDHGRTEEYNRVLKGSLREFVSDSTRNWGTKICPLITYTIISHPPSVL